MLTYRRKIGSGKLIMQRREGGHKARMASRKVLYPGDELTVACKEELPGWPSQIHGWELVEGYPEKERVPKPSKAFQGVTEALPNAKLQCLRQGSSNRWKVVIQEPGLNYTDGDVVLPVGTKVHPGFLTQERAEAWAANGRDALGGE